MSSFCWPYIFGLWKSSLFCIYLVSWISTGCDLHNEKFCFRENSLMNYLTNLWFVFFLLTFPPYIWSGKTSFFFISSLSLKLGPTLKWLFQHQIYIQFALSFLNPFRNNLAISFILLLQKIWNMKFWKQRNEWAKLYSF